MNRRQFVITAAGACGAVALWRLEAPRTAIAASTGSKTVSLVQFDARGKKTGTVVVPKIVKTDAEWQKQLSPLFLRSGPPGGYRAAVFRRYAERTRSGYF